MLLLHPVAGAVEDVTAAKAGQGLRVSIELGLRGGELQDAVTAAGDEERGLADRLAAPRRRLFPIAPQVAVPVEPAAKAGAREFLRIVIEIHQPQPCRQCRWIDGVAEQGARREPGEALALLGVVAARSEVD